ncbi:alpha/beta hydrolase [Sphaerisporangium sp. NBC_01403]|uniref:alpha/beta hydrolase n=1 Tax=Sphaerisporangium sp. NBC_01403 TaxID=2903599 RepID=UPI0032471125
MWPLRTVTENPFLRREIITVKTDVTFLSAGLKIAGHLYTPDAAGPHPAIVVSHPASGVKEQTAGLYARRLAEQGFVTLAFDTAYQGESEGEPRGLEDPSQRVEDIKSAVSFLTTREDVDADHIGTLGICASGGYVLAAAATDHRIKAVGTVSGVDVARMFRLGADGAQDPAVIQGMLDAAAAARTAEARGDGTRSFPVFPDTAEQALALGGRHGLEGFEYYCTDHAQHPRSAKTLTWSSIDRMEFFDAFRFVDLIAPRPLLVIVGREAVTSWMGVEAFQNARGPKELHWIESASHVDLYDKEEYLGPAVAKLTEFFEGNLAETA